ncbi:MAG: hypothetical protein ABIH59_03675 [archaeon]
MNDDACKNLTKLMAFQSMSIKRLLIDVGSDPMKRVEFISNYLEVEGNRLALREPFCKKCKYFNKCDVYDVISKRAN